MSAYEVVVGIETHVQLATKTKLFCDCDNDSRTAEPNSNVCPVCLGMPGALPVLNAHAVELALRAGQALNSYSEFKPFTTTFERKNYFYPDSPKGYQITQLNHPIVTGGYVELPSGKQIRITRAQLEGDAGKLTHPTGADYSLVDLNRADTPLLEIVSEPDMRSAEEAKTYAQELYNLMRYADISDADLYYGNMRFDVNVSLRKPGAKEYGTRTESKNLNSFRAVSGVVKYETERQAALLDAGKTVDQETRGWDEDKGVTFSQRGKEEAHDYRYFPEPDLPPVRITQDLVTAAAEQFPEDKHPSSIRKVIAESGVSPEAVEALVAQPTLAYLYLDTVVGGRKGYHRRIANWLVGEVSREFTDSSFLAGDIHLKPQSLIELAELVEDGKLSATAAKPVLSDMMQSGQPPEQIAQRLNLIQNSDSSAIDAMVDQVIQEHASVVEQYRNGDAKVFGFLVGQAMKASKGQGNPGMINQALKAKLDK